MSFASGADHQASSAIVSKQSLMSKIYTQSHFVHMLQTLPVSSIYEVVIMFTREFGIHPLVRDEFSSLIHGLLANCLVNIIITSKFDETGTVCSI